MNTFRAILFVVSLALLCSCANGPQRHPDRYITQTAPLPIPVSCVPTMPPELSYPDTPERLLAAPDIFEAAKLMKAGQIMRKQREKELSIALAACAGPVSK